mgnify:CR=1 FL=1
MWSTATRAQLNGDGDELAAQLGSAQLIDAGAAARKGSASRQPASCWKRKSDALQAETARCDLQAARV